MMQSNNYTVFRLGVEIIFYRCKHLKKIICEDVYYLFNRRLRQSGDLFPN